MRFTYYYKTSDNVRHEAEISAPSRDEAFAALRDRGIRPIKMVAANTQRGENGTNGSSRNIFAYVLSIAFILLAAGGGAWWLAARRDAAPYQMMTPQGPVTFTVATPLPRQMIPGDRGRIENGILGTGNGERGTGAFKFAGEAYLAQYAEPGRPTLISRQSQSSRQSQMSQEARAVEFKTCLKEPIRIANTDFTEIVDLKRIVAGMKREMRAYLAAGGTVEQYLGELEKRQRLEISYRENAERKLYEMLNKADDGRAARPESVPYREAYSYWLKANAQLQAMGIYPLALPDALRSYQMAMELD